MKFNPSNWPINNRTSIYILTIIITLVGLVSYINLPKEQFPEVKFPQIIVQTINPGTSPENMENLVSKPIEKQLKNQDILPIQSLSFEAFFVFFAIQSRQKISKKAILAQLKTNPHPLDKYRCNVPLSRTNVFRAIYNVKKENKMWWHSTNSVWN